ncbi:MAG: hypothetical protein OXH68_16990 [Gammaproteobacteria bacterium]|nr:hypothetical protein [Gammaproteobacteria bacterium]
MNRPRYIFDDSPGWLQFHKDALVDRYWRMLHGKRPYWSSIGRVTDEDRAAFHEWLQQAVGVDHVNFLTLETVITARDLLLQAEDAGVCDEGPSHPLTFGELERAVGLTVDDWQRLAERVATTWPGGFPCPPDDDGEYNTAVPDLSIWEPDEC